MPRPRRKNYRLWKPPGGEIYYIVWRNGGTGSRKVTTKCKDRAQAEHALAQFLAALETKDEGPAYDVATVLQRYFEARRGELADPDRVEHCIKPLARHIGWMKIADIRPSTSSAYIDLRHRDMAQDGTIRRELNCLRAAFNWAVQEELIEKAPRVRPPKKPPGKDRWLTHDQCRELLDACVSSHMRLFVQIALNTGARKGAILDLKWDRVFLDRRLIDFNETARQQTKKGRPIVPINDTLLAALQEQVPSRRSEWVIEWGGRRVTDVRVGFQDACKRAGLEKVTPHTLRHTAATHMAMAGVDMWLIAGMLGHTDSRITEQVYGHHSPDYLRKAAEKLG